MFSTGIALPTAPSPIRALHSLRELHAESAEAALTLLGAGWSTERVESYDGHMLLELVQDDEDACSFVLHGSADGVRLGLFSPDSDYAALGAFDSVHGAMHFAAQLIAGEVPMPAVAPAA